jgi:hypothetical protein
MTGKRNIDTDCIRITAYSQIIIIQFNSIRVYLRENLRAQRPITKLARVHRNIQK